MSEFRISGKSLERGAVVRRHGVDCGKVTLIALDTKVNIVVLHTASRRSLHGMRGMGTSYEAAHAVALPMTAFTSKPDGSWECRVPLFGAEFSLRKVQA